MSSIESDCPIFVPRIGRATAEQLLHRYAATYKDNIGSPPSDALFLFRESSQANSVAYTRLKDGNIIHATVTRQEIQDWPRLIEKDAEAVSSFFLELIGAISKNGIQSFEIEFNEPEEPAAPKPAAMGPATYASFAPNASSAAKLNLPTNNIIDLKEDNTKLVWKNPSGQKFLLRPWELLHIALALENNSSIQRFSIWNRSKSDVSWSCLLLEGLKDHKGLRSLAFSEAETPAFSAVVRSAPNLESISISSKMNKFNLFKAILSNAQRKSIKSVQDDSNDKLAMEEHLLLQEIKTKVNASFEYLNGTSTKKQAGAHTTGDGVDSNQGYGSFATLVQAPATSNNSDAAGANPRASFKQVPEGENYATFIPKVPVEEKKPEKSSHDGGKAKKDPDSHSKKPKPSPTTATSQKSTVSLSDLGIGLSPTIGAMLLDSTTTKPQKKKK